MECQVQREFDLVKHSSCCGAFIVSAFHTSPGKWLLTTAKLLFTAFLAAKSISSPFDTSQIFITGFIIFEALVKIYRIHTTKIQLLCHSTKIQRKVKFVRPKRLCLKHQLKTPRKTKSRICNYLKFTEYINKHKQSENAVLRLGGRGVGGSNPLTPTLKTARGCLKRKFEAASFFWQSGENLNIN